MKTNMNYEKTKMVRIPRFTQSHKESTVDSDIKRYMNEIQTKFNKKPTKEERRTTDDKQ